MTVDLASAQRPRHRVPVPLTAALAAIGVTDPGAGSGVEVTGVASDSRLVHPGDLYLALPGELTHGARFAAAARASGAVAVLTDPAGAGLIAAAGPAALPPLPVLVVPRPRELMASLAAAVYGRPAEALQTVGVTGTNGKTTTTFLIDAGLRAAGRHTGLVGTLGYRYDDRPLPGLRTTVTTPESAELQGLFAALRGLGADTVTMEVSSHALTLGRADAIVFDVAVFTNFGRDHLDFHGTEENYFAAKAGLFTAARARRAVINIDDPRGPELVRQAGDEGLEVVTTSLRSEDGAADYHAVRLVPAGPATALTVATPHGPVELALRLPGRYNAHNAVSAVAALDLLGVDLTAAAAGLGDVVVPGRMEPVPLAGPPVAPQVYVDFAHTPQAVGSALTALADRAGPDGRVICVLGCGGDRDPAKRGPMGAAAARGAALVVVTDDNPRSEDPAAIRAATVAGARAAVADEGLSTEVVDGGDRRAAIRLALMRAARPGSGPVERQVVAVLGKGHEQGQEIGTESWPFDDVAVVGELWADLVAGPADPASDPATGTGDDR